MDESMALNKSGSVDGKSKAGNAKRKLNCASLHVCLSYACGVIPIWTYHTSMHFAMIHYVLDRMRRKNSLNNIIKQ